MSEQFFMVVSNGRTGSTFLIASLGALADVEVDFEYKWRKPPDADIHRNIANASFNLKSSLNGITDRDCIKGSKLVFANHRRPRADGEELIRVFPEDMKIIHLTRSYWDIQLSACARGYVHLPGPGLAKNAESILCKNLLKQGSNYHGDPPLRDVPWTTDQIIIRMLGNFINDLNVFLLQKKVEKFYFVEYDDLESKLFDISSFIGSEASKADVQSLIDVPTVKKLPPISDSAIPNHVALKHFGTCLDKAFLQVKAGELDIDRIWTHDGKFRLWDQEIIDAYQKASNRKAA